MSEHSITVSELFLIAVLIGFPVYASGFFIQAVLIFLRQGFRLIAAIFCLLATFISSLLLAIFLWIVLPLPGEKYFMLFGAINTPALLAEIVMIPSCLKLFEHFINRPEKAIN